MLSQDEIRTKLSDRNIRTVAQRVGLHYNTVYRFYKRKGALSYESQQKLADYFSE
jgi:transposase